MMTSNGIVANPSEHDAPQRSVRSGTSRAPVSRAPDRPPREIEGEDAVAVGEDFEDLLRQVVGVGDSDKYTDDFARQVAEANRHAAANQRITEDDLRVPDEQQRASDRGARARQDPSQASAVAIQRGELGKGDLGHLYRPLSAAGNGQRGEVAAGSSSNDDPADSRGLSRRGVDVGGRAPRGRVDLIASERNQTSQKIPEVPDASAKASTLADARALAAVTAEAAARTAARRAPTPSNNRDMPGTERTGRAAQSQARQPIVQRSSELGTQPQSRQDSDLDGRDMKKPLETSARPESASKAKQAEPLSQSMRQQALDDVQRVVLSRRNEQHSLVRMQLSPPELGKLTIEMRMENNTLRIRFEAERPEVGELLKNSSTALSNALAEQGISVERYEVVLSEPDDFGHHLGAHSGPQDSPSESDAGSAAEGIEDSERLEGEEGQAEEVGALTGGAERRLDIKA